jgi:hypothetical protein
MFENAAPSLGEPSVIALVFHVQSYLTAFVHPPRAIPVPAVACTQVYEQEFRGECGI